MPPDTKAPDPPVSPALLASVVDQLACPVCFGGLGLEKANLRCAGCGRVYPVVDGIPVLIADQTLPAGTVKTYLDL